MASYKVCKYMLRQGLCVSTAQNNPANQLVWKPHHASKTNEKLNHYHVIIPHVISVHYKPSDRIVSVELRIKANSKENLPRNV